MRFTIRAISVFRVKFNVEFTRQAGNFSIIYIQKTYNDILDDFPKISGHFPKIPRKSSEGTFPNISRKWPKVFFRGRAEDVSIVRQQI